jgi:undecaprenyl phosphate N,N'-diacetylbacillosamine 1-phosphate transferase
MSVLIYRNFFKRLLDILCSITILPVLSPFLLLIAVLIKLETPGPLFFLQDRVGKDLNEFQVYKFRTMTDEKHEVKNMVGQSDGITTVGYYLRRFKIDEIPQLINVLKGEMSMVGPRPSINSLLEEMSQEEIRRYSVRPGMTGLAQVCGNIHLSWKDRYEYDLKYVNNVSLTNDILILLRTVLIVLKGEDKFIDKPLTIREYQL